MRKPPMTPILRRSISMLAMPLALAVAACTSISTPSSVDGVKRTVVLDNLATAQGKTVSDQDRIDGVMARGCATDLARPASCRRHTAASDARRKELEMSVQ